MCRMTFTEYTIIFSYFKSDFVLTNHTFQKFNNIWQFHRISRGKSVIKSMYSLNHGRRQIRQINDIDVELIKAETTKEMCCRNQDIWLLIRHLGKTINVSHFYAYQTQSGFIRFCSTSNASFAELI